MTRVAYTAATAYAVYTLWLVGRMFWFVSYSMTSALHVDELVMMEELHLFHEGKYGIGYLWSPYWGNRIPLPRLFMLADERFFHFSNTPLVVVSLLAQCLTATLLVWLEWRLLRNTPRWLTIFALTATVHLAFSSLQLECFLYGMAVQFTVSLLGAFASIALFAASIRDGKTSPRLAMAAFGCALLPAMSVGTSVFIAPVILLVAFGLRARPAVLVALTLVSAGFALVYSLGYTNPGSGMGAVGALRDPIGAIRIAALVLGGPITNQSLTWGAACGMTGMLLMLPETVRLLRGGGTPGQKQLWLAFVCS